MAYSTYRKIIERYHNCKFHMPWKYATYYKCAHKKCCNDRYYCRCLRDGSIRKSSNCNTECPNFKVRFRDKLKACWQILTEGFIWER